MEVVSADGTTFIFDVKDLVITGDDGVGEDNYFSTRPFEFNLCYTSYAISAYMEPDSGGVYFKMRLPAKAVLRTATIEVDSEHLPELERARKAVGAPADANWEVTVDGKSVIFEWRDE